LASLTNFAGFGAVEQMAFDARRRASMTAAHRQGGRLMHRQLIAIAVSLPFAAPAFALDMPTRKSGLWELHMVFEGHKLPAQKIQQCVDAATDKLMNSNFSGPEKEACSKRDISKTGDTMVIDSVCKFGSATTTSHAVVTGSFDSAYKVDVTSTRSGGRPLPGMTACKATHMTIEAKWLGPCAKGERPGDIIMGSGFKMNILDMQKKGMLPRR
jgi:Protein of unknown function (DUF3617)